MQGDLPPTKGSLRAQYRASASRISQDKLRLTYTQILYTHAKKAPLITILTGKYACLTSWLCCIAIRVIAVQTLADGSCCLKWRLYGSWLWRDTPPAWAVWAAVHLRMIHPVYFLIGQLCLGLLGIWLAPHLTLTAAKPLATLFLLISMLLAWYLVNVVVVRLLLAAGIAE